MNKKISKSHILLVEGRCDAGFLEALLKEFKLPPIAVLTPTECGEHEDNIYAVSRRLPQLLLELADNQIQKLGVLVDADYTNRNGGFAIRWKQLTAPLQREDYILPEKPPTEAYQGSVFQHRYGQPPVGLWVMPNHQGDGMLEDFIQQAVASGTQQTLLAKATDCVDQLPKELRRFSDFHHSKATLHTWLAWQNPPGLSLAVLPKKESLAKKPTQPLLDLTAVGIQGFQRWLARVFT
jgi:hypothetical protein